MYNFYQSWLRTTINRDVYGKPTGTITLIGKEYQYIVKCKSVLGVTLNWYQILGIELPLEYLTNPDLFREWVIKVCRAHFGSQGDCFVQLGLINQLGMIHIDETKSDWYHTHRDSVRRQQGSAIMRLGGYDGLVENMPAATIMIDLSQSEESLLSDMAGRTRTQIRKAQQYGLRVEIASLNDWDVYYDMWVETGDTKWFAVQSRVAYEALRDYLLKTQQWHLYVVRDGEMIVAGAICVIVEDVYVYLYGATRRGIGNLGHAQLLQRSIIQSAKEQWFAHYDLLWCSPGGIQPHHLNGVTQFKSGFGGQKVEYLGNYDFPLSNRKYEMFKWYRSIKR